MKREPTPPEIDALLAHASWVRSLARCLVGRDDLADDVAQQTWLTALQRPPRHLLHVRAWLAQATRNVARKLRRDEAARTRREQRSPGGASEPAPDEVLARATLQRQVVDAVLRLSDPYRRTILLRFFEGLPPRAIARCEQVPIETVRTRLKRALALLRESLTRDLGGEEVWAVALVRLVERPAVPVAASAGALWTGVLLMSTKVKLAAVVIVLAGATAGTLAFLQERSHERATEDASRGRGPVAAAPRSSPAGASLESPDSPGRTEQPARPTTPAETTPASDRGTVRGIVRTALGEPVSEALVIAGDPRVETAFESWSFFDQRAIADAGRRGGGQGNGWVLVKADAGGRYEIRELAPGPRWTLAAWHRRGGAQVLFGVALEAGRSKELDIPLRDGVILFGAVTDLRGAPVKGASVTIMRIVREGRRTTYSGESNLLADASGEYESYPLRCGSFQVSAASPGLKTAEPHAFEVAPGEFEHRIDLTLESETKSAGEREPQVEPAPPAARGVGSLAIHVHDAATGDAIDRFTVEIAPVFRARATEEERRILHATGTSGVADVARVPVDQYGLTVRSTSHLPAFERVTVHAGETPTQVDVAMQSGAASIGGVVRDPDGRPITNIDVFLLRPDGEPAVAPPDHVTKTNREGRFGFSSVPAGACLIVASPSLQPGPEDGASRAKLSAASATVMIASEPAEVSITLVPAIEIEIDPKCGSDDFVEDCAIRVLDAQGVPVIDYLRPGRELRSGFNALPLFVPAGILTVELHSPGYRVGRATFRASPGLHVSVALERER